MLKQKEAYVLEPEQRDMLCLICAVRPEVGTYHQVLTLIQVTERERLWVLTERWCHPKVFYPSVRNVPRSIIRGGASNEAVLTNNDVPARGTSLLVLYPLLYVPGHVLEIFQLTIMLHLYTQSLSTIKRGKLFTGQLAHPPWKARIRFPFQRGITQEDTYCRHLGKLARSWWSAPRACHWSWLGAQSHRSPYPWSTWPLPFYFS